MSRLDKWLFHARFYRTRALAQAATAAGRVRLNGVRVDKPGHALKPGDVLTLGKAGQVMAVRGVLPLDDATALGRTELQWCYTVAFAGPELWGEGSDPKLTVSIEAWESYLEPA